MAEDKTQTTEDTTEGIVEKKGISQNDTSIVGEQNSLDSEIGPIPSDQDNVPANETEPSLGMKNEMATLAEGDNTNIVGAEHSKTSYVRGLDSHSNKDENINEVYRVYRRPISDRTTSVLNYGGLFFMLTSGAALIVIALVLYKMSSTGGLTPPTETIGGIELLKRFMYVFSAPLLLLLASLLASIIGYALLRAAGTATKQVVNHEDMELLTLLLTNNKQSFIDDYVRLSSLTGLTGMFTKVGLYGLPLATIILTIVFTVLAMILNGNQQLFDLAKLTLGAFIGSYVQRQSAEVQAQDVRRQVADVQSKITDVQKKVTDVQSKV